ncbi:hypothetical protein [Chitinibacter tainanensis]|uniref:hypothetical protein n=1 Tax=Chitinibacter tainanensis TaxID=230667 RepID=UPI0023528CC4|nr:hypothetical protein [Chitinibacter tainanensis]
MPEDITSVTTNELIARIRQAEAMRRGAVNNLHREGPEYLEACEELVRRGYQELIDEIRRGVNRCANNPCVEGKNTAHLPAKPTGKCKFCGFPMP